MATATLVYDPADPAARRVESRRFTFTAPLGPIEADELRWYLESYYLWPTGVFKARAERIEAQLPQWGQDLYHAVVATKHAQEALHAWQHATAEVERRFSVLVDSDLPDGSTPEAQAAAKEAATGLLALPWELLHDGRSSLFQGQHAVRVCRRLPNRYAQPHAVTDLPIRILLVSPRPEHAQTSYIDHRISALPLVEAVERLGELAELTVLTPPTFPALQQALQRAAATQQPPAAAAPVAELWRLCQDLLNADPATCLLFTSREALPEPFAHRRADMVLEALSQADAIALVSQVMAQEGATPHPSDPGSTPQEITDLVEAVGRHPRALVLLAREVARRGVRATTDTVRALMMALHDRYPDDRDPTLATDPALDYDDAAELLLLLETLGGR